MAEKSIQRTRTLEQLYIDHIEHLHKAYSSAIVECGYDALVIHSGCAAKQSLFDDQYWTFKPTPAFAHWLPLRDPNVTLLLQPGNKPVLFCKLTQDYWEGDKEPESNHFWGSFKNTKVNEFSEISKLLPTGKLAFIGDSLITASVFGVGADAVNPADLLHRLDAVRTRKTEYERLCITEANRRAAIGHQALIHEFLSNDVSELELHLTYLKATSQDDIETPYKNIVALDEHAAILHHIHYSRTAPVNSTQSLLVDAGAMCLGYVSDITRTTMKSAVQGDVSATFEELIHRMEGLQAEIIRRIEPGLTYERLHDQAHELLVGILRDLGISSASEQELLDSGASRAFFPHGLGHSLGIQVHDVGCRIEPPRADNPFLRNTSTITPGQVFTIEPGCYFIPQLMDELRPKPVGARINWPLVDELARFGGVRIEDNIAIVDGGTMNMTRDNWPSSP